MVFNATGGQIEVFQFLFKVDSTFYSKVMTIFIWKSAGCLPPTHFIVFHIQHLHCNDITPHSKNA